MLAYNAAHRCLRSFTTDSSPDQIKRNIDVMKKAADDVVVNEIRERRGPKQDKDEVKKKQHGQKRRIPH